MLILDLLEDGFYVVRITVAVAVFPLTIIYIVGTALMLGEDAWDHWQTLFGSSSSHREQRIAKKKHEELKNYINSIPQPPDYDSLTPKERYERYHYPLHNNGHPDTPIKWNSDGI